MKKLNYIMAAAMCLAASSCKYGDPKPVPAPVVTPAPNTLSGVITNLDGKPLQGVEVAMGSLKTLTGIDGSYLLPNVPAGVFTVTASANGYFSNSQTITIPARQTSDVSFSYNMVWCSALPKIESTTAQITVSGGGSANIKSDAVEGNDQYGSVGITVTAQTGAVTQNTGVVITPVYTEAHVTGSRAVEDKGVMLIGAIVESKSGNSTIAPDRNINLTFNVDKSIDKLEVYQYSAGKWNRTTGTLTDDGLVVPVKTFGTIGVFAPVQEQQVPGTEDVAFERNLWDNLYGKKEISVGSVAYTYMQGNKILTVARNNNEGLMVERLVKTYGGTVTTVNAQYDVNKNFPIGTAFKLEGIQNYSTITLTNGTDRVSSKKYGSVRISTRSWNRSHDGGGSGN